MIISDISDAIAFGGKLLPTVSSHISHLTSHNHLLRTDRVRSSPSGSQLGGGASVIRRQIWLFRLAGSVSIAAMRWDDFRYCKSWNPPGEGNAIWMGKSCIFSFFFICCISFFSEAKYESTKRHTSDWHCPKIRTVCKYYSVLDGQSNASGAPDVMLKNPTRAKNYR